MDAEAPLDPANDGQGYKRCPDCAELVREGARKCRFCGYRFDGEGLEPARSEGRAHDEAPARSGRRRAAAQPESVRELLGEWGTELDPEEEISFFLPARAKLLAAGNQVFGYLLVTDRRLLMMAPPTRNILSLLRRESKREPADVAIEIDLSEAGELSARKRWRREQLLIGDHILIDEVEPRRLGEIRRHIEARA